MILLYLYLGVVVFHFGALFQLSLYAGPDRSNAIIVPRGISRSRYVHLGLAFALMAPLVLSAVAVTGHLRIAFSFATLLIVADVILIYLAVRKFMRVERTFAETAEDSGVVGSDAPH